MKKDILIVGQIARDHALAWKFTQSPRAGKIYVAPGNGGTESIATNIDIAVDDYPRLRSFAREHSIDLVYVSGDKQLGDGLVDMFKSDGIAAFGPKKGSAQIEASKAFAKDFMATHSIPTAAYKVFEKYEEAKEYLASQKVPIVIKASGLADGKGAIICETRTEAEETLRDIMLRKQLGDAGNQVVIEEYMRGPEISVHAFSDGIHYRLFPPAQDHKAIHDGNTGPNTGGMGVITPLPGVSESLMQNIDLRIVKPVIDGMNQDKTPFSGVLYPGVMLTDSGPKVLEYNARLGDPEAQSYLRILDTDLLDIVEACIDGTLDQVDITWSEKTAVNVVLASGGYPRAYEKGMEITGIAEAETDPDVVVFHAGTKIENERLLTNGGRVLCVSAIGEDLDDALARAYQAADKIHFEGKTMRTDIGHAHNNEKLKDF